MSETHDETRLLTVTFEYGDQKEIYTFEDKDDFVYRVGTVNVPNPSTAITITCNKVKEPLRVER